jgi:OOP family OmpA-OmpF porin
MKINRLTKQLKEIIRCLKLMIANLEYSMWLNYKSLLKNVNLIILIFLSSISYAQSQNMVINPGFEETDTINIKKSFENMSCLTAWQFKVFNKRSFYLGKTTPINNFRYASLVNNGLSPKSGNTMAEISTLNFTQNSNHQNQSFLAGKLRKPLIKGRSYYFEMWYSLDWFSNSASNNIGVYFADSMAFAKTDRTNIEPELNSECILYTHPAQWKKLSGNFVARNNGNMFVIGNFSNNKSTKHVAVENPFQYNNKEGWDKLRDTTILSNYFLDDVMVTLTKTPAVINSFGCDDNFSNLKTGQVIPLNNIYFETAKSRLLMQSTIQLDELFVAMQQHPALEIEISGHTDNTGNSVQNQTLSENRAKSVNDYLVQKGIQTERIKYLGFGMTKPVAPNDCGENKAKNRRVEIRIIKI